MCAVGEILHKDLGAVRELPLSELYTWLAWVKFKNEGEKKALKEAKAKPPPAKKPTRSMGKRR